MLECNSTSKGMLDLRLHCVTVIKKNVLYGKSVWNTGEQGNHQWYKWPFLSYGKPKDSAVGCVLIDSCMRSKYIGIALHSNSGLQNDSELSHCVTKDNSYTQLNQRLVRCNPSKSSRKENQRILF